MPRSSWFLIFGDTAVRLYGSQANKKGISASQGLCFQKRPKLVSTCMLCVRFGHQKVSFEDEARLRL